MLMKIIIIHLLSKKKSKYKIKSVDNDDTNEFQKAEIKTGP